MKAEKKKLERISEALGRAPSNRVRLFFVTRHLKDGVSRTSKMLDRHEFRVRRASLNPDLQKYFLDLLAKQVTSTVARDGVEIAEYAVVDDNLDDKIYTYPLHNAKSFSDVVNRKLKQGVDTPTLRCLAEIKSDLWAYCIAVELPNIKEPLYSFRRISRGKVISDAKSLKEKILCHFDTGDAKLNLVKGETLVFDEKVDCLCFGDVFYVLRKSAFESLLGMEEEFKENAESVVGTLRDAGIVDGVEILSQEILGTSTYLKRVAHICRAGGCGDLGPARIKRMEQTAKKLGLALRTKGGKLVVEDKDDVVLILRMLDKYYLECMQTGDAYGSHAKVKLAPAT